MEKKRIHYAWVIMLALILLMIGAGATSCMVGNFITPVVTEFGCKVNQFTLFLSIDAIGMSIFYVPAARIISTKKIGVTLGIATLCEVIGIALMYTYRSVWGFYFSGFLIGSAGAFTGYVAIPIIVNMWFKKLAGTVLGVIIAVGNAASVAFGLLSAQLITARGWREAYLIIAVIAFFFMVPEVFFLLKSPQEVGCEPYGAQEAAAEETLHPQPSNLAGNAVKKALASPAFWLAWIACLCYSYGTSIPGYIATCTTMELGQTTAFGANAQTFVSVGAILCSVVLGRLNDKYGVRAGLLWGAVFSLAGYSVVLLAFKQLWLFIPGALLVGLSNGMYAVQAPLLCKKIVSEENYSQVWSVMMVGNSLIGGGFCFTIGFFYDYGGTYRGAFVLGAVLYIIAMAIALAALRLNRKKQPESV